MASGPRRDFFQEGIDLFNSGKFFECHEAWEEIWKHAHGEEKLFLHGLIQAAVAILHAQRGNLEGARTLRDKSLKKLDRFDSERGGIALNELRNSLRKFFETALSGGTTPLPPPPQILRVPVEK
ncbi:MAG TPA: DUF309 domain-containing protein [Candidatus Binataceae bacterium]|nr:DUF309 domain-containing protein [Candidatus Binataceae bacterium]